jgi:hypothetical protein
MRCGASPCHPPAASVLRQERRAIALYRRERLAFAAMSVRKAINTTLSLLTSFEADADISRHVI